MKKQVLSFLLLFTATLAIAQNSNCTKIKSLISEANSKQMGNEATGEKFQTTDDFDAWTATTVLDGATKCYVQDAHVAKMYVAEFGTAAADNRVADASLAQKMESLNKDFSTCILNKNFVSRDIKSSENIFKGYQYDGTGANLNTRIMLMQVYNPAAKQQQLFLSIINDPGK
jgi:hypothetical protein